jgi:hypothetical protein
MYSIFYCLQLILFYIIEEVRSSGGVKPLTDNKYAKRKFVFII